MELKVRHRPAWILLATLIALGVASAAVVRAATFEVIADPTGVTFEPSSLTIHAGDTVSVTKEAGGLKHNVHWNDQADGCPVSATTDAWTCNRTFNATGTFVGVCDVHAGMKVTVTVQANATPAPTPQSTPPPPSTPTPVPPGTAPPTARPPTAPPPATAPSTTSTAGTGTPPLPGGSSTSAPGANPGTSATAPAMAPTAAPPAASGDGPAATGPSAGAASGPVEPLESGTVPASPAGGATGGLGDDGEAAAGRDSGPAAVVAVLILGLTLAIGGASALWFRRHGGAGA